MIWHDNEGITFDFFEEAISPLDALSQTGLCLCGDIATGLATMNNGRVYLCGNHVVIGILYGIYATIMDAAREVSGDVEAVAACAQALHNAHWHTQLLESSPSGMVTRLEAG